ncbi:hypothetical protein HanIR_Chr09g0429871 [Helianthus annuus]|nr:hypothetical protein HanIR_Chr09g0429871 [Helianthus annuus]
MSGVSNKWTGTAPVNLSVKPVGDWFIIARATYSYSSSLTSLSHILPLSLPNGIQIFSVISPNEKMVEWVGERFGVPCDPGSIATLLIILCGIQVKDEYGWRRFVLDGRRGFYRLFHCRAFGRVSVHLGEPRGWRRSNSRPWLQRPMSR